MMLKATILHRKAILGRGYPGLMRRFFWYESCPRCSINHSTCWPAVERGTSTPQLPLQHIYTDSVVAYLHCLMISCSYPSFLLLLLWSLLLAALRSALHLAYFCCHLATSVCSCKFYNTQTTRILSYILVISDLFYIILRVGIWFSSLTNQDECFTI